MSTKLHIVKTHTIRASSLHHQGQEFSSASVTYDDKDESLTTQASGRGHYRALAFALRDLADWLLREHPPEWPNKDRE